MKKIIWIFAIVVGLAVVAAWQCGKIPIIKVLCPQSTVHGPEQYTCPMHPQVVQDKPGNCPICGMKLVPVPKKAPEHKHPEGALFVDPGRLQLIGVRKAPVEVKELTREVRLPGRVAYDQELFVTEQEYVQGLKLGVESEVLKTIESKLVRLGISAEEMDQLRATKKPDSALYLPDPHGPFWVYANVYEADLSWVEAGMKASVSLPKEPAVVWEGAVKQVAPIVDMMTRTATARIWIAQPVTTLKPETYVDVVLQKSLGKTLAVPSEAVIETGTAQVVLVDLGEGYLEPREVKLGLRAGADYPVLEGLKTGEVVLTSAHFLIDSEAALQAALKRFGGMPEGHQH